MRGRLFSKAMRWARKIFLQVMGTKAPAFTVASLAMTITVWPATCPMPVSTPAATNFPHCPYIPCAAHRPNSRKRVLPSPESSNASIRSRAVIRPNWCWRSNPLAPPPSRSFASSSKNASQWAHSGFPRRALEGGALASFMRIISEERAGWGAMRESNRGTKFSYNTCQTRGYLA